MFLQAMSMIRLAITVLVMAALSAGCADDLEIVHRDGTVSDLGGDASDAPTDRVNDDVATDGGDTGDELTIDVILADGADVTPTDADVADGGSDGSADVGNDDSMSVDALDVTDAPTDRPADADGGVPCPPGMPVVCGGACTNVQTDLANCGRCGNACPVVSNAAATCVAGVCGFTCNTGFTNCSGACANLSNDRMNCGSCGNRCMLPNATAVCLAPGCQVAACNTGFADCDGLDVNGCEVNLQTEAANCGRCGNACTTAAPFCAAGGCTGICPTATPTLCSGGCVNTQSDPMHCGSCATPCVAGMDARATCVAGMCGFVCNTGFHLCSGGCVSNLSVATCGGSCTPCEARPNTTPSCDGVACRYACNTGFADCDGNPANGCEANLASSAANCGRCGGVCPAGIACGRGLCIDVAYRPSAYGTLGVEGVSSWEAANVATTATIIDRRYVSASNYRYSTGGGFEIQRGWARFVGLPTMIAGARLHVGGPYGTWGNTVPQVLTICQFTPGTETPGTSDFSLAHWGTSAFGSVPNALLGGAREADIVLSSEGVTALLRTGFLGLRMEGDLFGRPETDPSNANIVVFGTTALPPNIQLLVTSAP